MSNIDRNIKELLDWYIEKQDPVPMQLHSSKVFGGDGRPDWTAAFKEYLFWSPEAIEYRYDDVPCRHENQTDPGRCELCGIRDANGAVLTSSGKYRKPTVRYRHPMRRALAKLAQGERGMMFTEILLICSQQGATMGIRGMETDLNISQERAKQLLLLALVRVARYYKNEPQHGALGIAYSKQMRHNYRRPRRLGTPDRSE
jgi:hypothetical protein